MRRARSFSRLLSLLLCTFLTSTLSACDNAPTPEGPTDLGVSGGFRVSLDHGDGTKEGARLVIASDDGRILIDGLPPGDVPPDGPPLVGFALRDVAISYEMQFGAFKPTEEPKAPWRVATDL